MATSAARVFRGGDEGRARADQTVDLAEGLRQEFRGRDQLYREIDDVLFNRQDVSIPEAYQKTAVKVQTPLPLHITNTVAAALSVNPASVQFRPVGFGDVHQQNASAREHFFEASWERQQEESRRRLLRLFLYSLAAKGEGVLKTVERRNAAWGEYYKSSRALEAELAKDRELDSDARDRVYMKKSEEGKLGLPYPIATTDVPPETFYYTLNENGFTSCVEVKQLPLYECLERFNVGVDGQGRLVTAEDEVDPRLLGLARSEWADGGYRGEVKTVTCIEAWDYEYQRIVLIGPGDTGSRSGSLGRGTLVRELKHRYGDLNLKTLRGPYFHALGITTASRLPERAGLSVLFGFLRLFPLLNSLLTMQANAAFMTGFPAFKRTIAPGSIPGIPESQLPYGSDGSEASPDQIVPGEIYPYDITPVEMPQAGPDASKLIDNIQSMIKLAMPDVVQGIMASDQSGYAINQAAHLARLAWDPIVANAETALGQRTGFESWLVENCIGEAVYAWGEQRQKGRNKGAPTRAAWLKIEPGDLNGIHRYRVRLDPETPSNKVIETRALIEQMNARLISYEDAVTEAGSNPDEVELSWYTQDIKKSPEMQALVKQLTLQQIGTIVQQKIAASGVKIDELIGAGQGTPPGLPSPNLNQAGAPPPNPVPMPGAGLPIAPPPPGGGGPAMPPGGIPIQPGPVAGMPMVPNVPANMIPLPGQA